MSTSKFSDEERARTVIVKEPDIPAEEAKNISDRFNVRPRAAKSGNSVFFMCANANTAILVRDFLKVKHPTAIISRDISEITLVYHSTDINTLMDQASLTPHTTHHHVERKSKG
eukprot:Phypoly_transcript_25730.p1 GENE.Phypoly_transcript_25730~~Phypoly_transcript_25730.p1  ORF type:complete len:114 (+),score=16.53 Phypoly_transcript_25730:111-452(+)